MLPQVNPEERLKNRINSLINAPDHSLKAFIQGEVLTVTDAIITDPAQRKAVKDLIRKAVWSKEVFSTDAVSEEVDRFVEEFTKPIN